MSSRIIQQGGQDPDHLLITKIKGPTLRLDLTYEQVGGERGPLGGFVLSMAELAALGHVRPRIDGRGFDLQIRVVDGEPWFWLNQASAARMAPWCIDSRRYSTLQAVSDALNACAESYKIGRLHEIRKELKRMSRVASSTLFPSEVPNPDWTFHVGGRQELQFNIGYDQADSGRDHRVLRYGVAFSFEPSRTMTAPEVDLVPHVARFNDALRNHLERLEGLQMWSWHNGHRTPNERPRPLGPVEIQRGTFAFFGWELAENPSDKDIDNVLARLDQLLPLYLDTVDPDRVAIPARPTLSEPRAPPTDALTTTTAAIHARTLVVDLRHRVIQRVLYDELVAEHGRDRIWWERPTSIGTLVDIAVDLGDRGGLMLFEVKTAASARACIREALGQLLEYAHWPGEPPPSRLIVAGEPALTEAAAAYLATLRTTYGLPIEYRRVTVP